MAKATAISSSTQQAAAYAIDPPLGIAGAAPLVMINLSRDHQLFYKAYNDFTDINGDGVIDTTYRNDFTYAGYFDPTKCYDYSTSLNYFVPSVVMGDDRYCTKQWSGNFLNWATMSRMDEVRKILYGGLRSTDTASHHRARACLPADGRAFLRQVLQRHRYQQGHAVYGRPLRRQSADTSAKYYFDTKSVNENGKYLPSLADASVSRFAGPADRRPDQDRG